MIKKYWLEKAKMKKLFFESYKVCFKCGTYTRVDANGLCNKCNNGTTV